MPNVCNYSPDSFATRKDASNAFVWLINEEWNLDFWNEKN